MKLVTVLAPSMVLAQDAEGRALLSTDELVAMTLYTSGHKTRRLVFADTRELIVAWPFAIAPATHAEAASEALRLIRTGIDR